MRWLGSLAVAIVAGTLAGGGWLFQLGPWRSVDMTMEAPPPAPALVGLSADAWRDARSALLDAFQREVYGAAPAPIIPIVASKQEIAPAQAGGVERVEQWRVELGDAGRFHLAIARPRGGAPAPVILVLDFCGNRAAFPSRPRAIEGPVGYVQWFCEAAALDPVAESVFGRYVNGPPIARITERGYAVALLYAGDVAPDREVEARAALARFAPADTGTLMAWAWTASRAYDALAADPRFDARRIALWGQSRQGKAALVAGAFDQRFAAIVALQSGRGGDAPNHALVGESVARITQTYPHWFSPRFASAAPSVEQHQLLALIAPRPLLLGHAARDEWSDPVGARAVREAAAPIYELLGAAAPEDFVRGGGHGITLRDWDETLAFLDARMRVTPP